MRTKKFQRTDVRKYSKLGVRRKNKVKYRKAKGRDNKIRLKMKGHIRNVSAGFRGAKKERGLVNGLKPVLIHNLKELKSLEKNEIGIVAKIGNKKRKEIAEYIQKEKIVLMNLNPKKFLRKLEIQSKEKKEIAEKRKKTKLDKDKKAKKEAEKKEKEEKKKSEEKKSKEIEKDKPKIKTEKQKETKKEIKTNNYGRGK